MRTVDGDLTSPFSHDVPMGARALSFAPDFPMPIFRLAPVLLLAGCVAAAPNVTPADHPAAPSAPHTTTSLTTFAPAAAPDLPPPLVPDGDPPGPGGEMASMDHAMHAAPAADHAGMSHSDHEMQAGAASDSLGALLTAYVGIQEALAADDLAAAQSAARILSSVPEVDTLAVYAGAIAAATDLVDARLAFGELSVGVARLAQANGVSDLTLFRCGMAKAPMGGVWLQRGTSTRNPYFGSSMLMCGSRIDALPTSANGGRHDEH